MMPEVVFDSDDFSMYPGRNCMDELLFLKDKFPNFKITLFTIPKYKALTQVDFFRMVVNGYGSWIQLALHGQFHETNFECQNWSYYDATAYLYQYQNDPLFVKGFKAPGWQISRDTYRALRDYGYWIMDHNISIYTENVPNKERRPPDLKVFEIDDTRLIHTHTWDTESNGIGKMIEKWEKEGYPFDDKTNFKFVSEVV